ncbi:DNA gyrase subunit A [Candidatus Phytoplasma gossypii]|uniref:DNA topoisomerase (ATP-hydrolyzing) n=1 Tax=Candidatus Phytoplasma gossypii TaxID=2982629 RepID=A0ABT9D1P8_9MOLU|nr:DNA gyrase subunit A ['Gossypium sp.' phytoplasma]MDO8057441.1 DNA gyrase subunit A ['Gossypium sp.' phytoplasma]
MILKKIKKNDHLNEEYNPLDSKINLNRVEIVDINEEVKKSFLSYAMSVIVRRALPDVRDGMKPVQRRILYIMNDLGLANQERFKKSAAVVGAVMGRCHPHGDNSIYEAMVRMAQDFNYRYPLIKGHGNFGSIDGDSAAAMRYTEARMSKIAIELIRNIEQETVDFIDTYDGNEKEPTVLPTLFPNLLVNGSTGIAVGMATNIPPHNFKEVVNALIAFINNKDIEVKELMKYIKGPDFPTGGEILGADNLKNIYDTGKGRIFIRSKAQIIQNDKNKNSIIITEIPFQIKKSSLIESIVLLAKEKIIDGITDLRDESNRKGIKLVIDLKRDINPHVVLNNLYKNSQVQVSFNFNMIALVKGVPKIVNLKQMLKEFLDFRINVIQRQKKFELSKALKKQHLVKALIIALNDIDQVVELIKASSNAKSAQIQLMEKYQLDEPQSKVILEMSLQRITNLEIEKIKQENKELSLKIVECENIINSISLKEQILKQDLLNLQKIFQDPRRTVINTENHNLDIDESSLIEKEKILITITHKGYIKRLSLDTYKKQNKGGKGVIGITMNQNDFVEHFAITSTHDYQLFFTNKGKVYQIKGYEIASYSRHAKGIPLVNLIPIAKGEFLTTLTSVTEFTNNKDYLVLVTKKGFIKRNLIQEYANIRSNGKIAFALKEDDEVLAVLKTSGHQDIILASSGGKSIRLKENFIRTTHRRGTGVIGMRMDKNEQIVGAAVVSHPEQDILVVTEFGYGKKTQASFYKPQKRGGKGVKTLKITDKKGKLVTLKTIFPNEELILISHLGQVIRIEANKVSTTKSKNTQGNRLFKLKEDDKLINVVVVQKQEDVQKID